MDTTATRMRVARILSGFRERMQVSQERLAAMAGVDRTYVGKLERCLVNPTLAKVDRLLQACGVTWAEFGAALHDARNR